MGNFSFEINRYIEKQSRRYRELSIIDVGCGTGQYTYYFGRRNTVTGIDIQNVVQEKYRNFKFRHDDTTKLSFKPNTFDLVISFDVIEHVHQDKKMVSEIYRILKKNGTVFLGTPNKNRLSNSLLKCIGRPRKYPLFVGHDNSLGNMIHVREYTLNELVSMFKKTGFKKIKVTPFWFGLTPLPFGLTHIPKQLQSFCQYLFIHAVK